MKAFPHGEVVNFIEGEIAPKITKPSAGMDLRDYFAAKAMQAILDKQDELDWNFLDMSKVAYSIADSMTKAREL
jgi:hypothetical protein